MNLIHRPSPATSTGDAIPFYHAGIYHIFSLTPPSGTTVYPARLRTIWSHMVSTDLVHWEEVLPSLYPSDNPQDPDASGIWTGSVLYGEGKYHAFYTGYSLSCTYQQTICHATSEDSIRWTKDSKNPVIIPLVEQYEDLDWRDPYVFFNDEDGMYWILISARKKTGAINRRGVIILYRSKDLKTWTYYGPLYEPGNTNCPECPEMYKMGKVWYLSYSRFSEFVNTLYRVSDSPFGPWRTPRQDGIGGRRFYAAKSMQNDQGRRFYFGWAHDRAGNSDTGEWYWGGVFGVPHEVIQNTEGELDVKLPEEIEGQMVDPIAWKYKPVEGISRLITPKIISISSISTTTYGFFNIQDSGFIFKCTITPHEARDSFGLLLKSDNEASSCLVLSFETAMQRVSLLNLPMSVDPFWQQSCQAIPEPKDPGPDGFRVCEKPFPIYDNCGITVKVIVDNDLIELFIGDKIAFSYRSYAQAEHQLGLIVQDGNAEYKDIEILK
ncbi:family 43 glycosylhydrolase [uncultured Sphaerochaeta sp.]|uniref:family 43 glycosylhydrolase n=1 Tax=uncultured Sphaerochaeta sp. TaxID=886478 RepID=UPI002A0A693C|nr:GH32 C-terminal domain-containing protein [uncultured Sphaerochaeta sp.]